MMLKIGCFGSVITFSPDRDICKRCELRDACAKTVFDREPGVINLLVNRETSRGTKRVDEVEGRAIALTQKYFARRRLKYLNEDVAKTPRFLKDYQAMIDNGIDFSIMSQGQNPIPSTYQKYLFMRHGVEFILAEKIFNARDIQEHFVSLGLYNKASTARSYSNRIVSILLHSEQIKKEGKVYCLSA